MNRAKTVNIESMPTQAPPRESRKYEKAKALFDRYQNCRRAYELARDNGACADTLANKYNALEKAFARYSNYHRLLRC